MENNFFFLIALKKRGQNEVRKVYLELLTTCNCKSKSS